MFGYLGWNYWLLKLLKKVNFKQKDMLQHFLIEVVPRSGPEYRVLKCDNKNMTTPSMFKVEHMVEI